MFKILVVEDDSELRGLFGKVLLKNGFKFKYPEISEALAAK